MAKIKIEFKPSKESSDEGTIVYRVKHSKDCGAIFTGYRIASDIWNEISAEFAAPKSLNIDRIRFRTVAEYRIVRDYGRLCRITEDLRAENRKFSAADIIERYESAQSALSLRGFVEYLIRKFGSANRIRTCEIYRTSVYSFLRFLGSEDIAMDDITSGLVQEYELYLSKNRCVRNTISFYMRNLRSIYNRAVAQNMISQHSPFKYVYTGIDKTVKRAISIHSVGHIKRLDLSGEPDLDFARDMFLFSLYTRGMSFVDMAYLKKKDLYNGRLSYKRRKTGQCLSVGWEDCMQNIVDKYDIPNSEYMLPIISHSETDERKQYKNVMRRINAGLKRIGFMIDLQLPLTMYVARHTWASAAKNCNIPISVISEALGHDSEQTTRIYLKSLDMAAIDEANNLILRMF